MESKSQETTESAKASASTSKTEQGSPAQTSSIGELQSEKEDYGYVFFSKRDTIGTKDERESYFGRFFEVLSMASILHKRCLKNVVRCSVEDPFVRLLLAAMKSKGCEVDLTRHISCEPCIGPVNGGFDSNHKQVAICENNTRKRRMVCAVMRHELIHAFDYCRAKLDLFNNIDHVACTEIRAANFTHCSYTTAFYQGLIPRTKLADVQRQCVRAKALGSVLGARNVSREEAEEAVDRVFERCYADLEPFGIRPKRGSFKEDCRRAYQDAKYYGYVDFDEKSE